MRSLIPSHGGGGFYLSLVSNEQERFERLRESEALPKIMMNSKEASDVIMLSTGVFTPLKGFMVQRAYEKVLSEMRLKDGIR